MKNILIVGLGNIGFRHYQSILKSKYRFKLHIVDKDSNKLKIACDYYDNLIKKKKLKIKLSYYSNIPKIHSEVNVAIIATNADIRKFLIKELVRKNKVKNLILEKIAFQTFREYKYINNLINLKKINTFINFPRRTMTFYKNLKKIIRAKSSVRMNVKGFNWGLASNSLHMVDLLTFLTNEKIHSIKDFSLHKKLFKTKRNNFYDFKGTMEFETKNKSTLLIEDVKSYKNVNFCIEISFRNITYCIYEGLSEVTKCINEGKMIKLSKKTIFPYQSSLTQNLIENLLDKRKIDLVKINDSLDNHKIYLNMFNNFIKQIDSKYKKCPIT